MTLKTRIEIDSKAGIVRVYSVKTGELLYEVKG